MTKYRCFVVFKVNRLLSVYFWIIYVKINYTRNCECIPELQHLSIERNKIEINQILINLQRFRC